DFSVCTSDLHVAVITLVLRLFELDLGVDVGVGMHDLLFGSGLVLNRKQLAVPPSPVAGPVREPSWGVVAGRPPGGVLWLL
ncbi:hypothetical protein, partial [Pseudomonas syringae group genomosp. 7]|uniref:hypothetical protein n=1 Tax=Pseudomonas syringae group genomosp. 7 TaxID=251699 RepID=UPI0037701E94